jgi:hypothetical protein
MVSNWVIVGAGLDSQFHFGPLNPYPHPYRYTCLGLPPDACFALPAVKRPSLCATTEADHACPRRLPCPALPCPPLCSQTPGSHTVPNVMVHTWFVHTCRGRALPPTPLRRAGSMRRTCTRPARMPQRWPRKEQLGTSREAKNNSAQARYCKDGDRQGTDKGPTRDRQGNRELTQGYRHSPDSGGRGGRGAGAARTVVRK